MRVARPLVAILFLSTLGVAAAAENPAATGKSTYGTAGCGLGSMVFGDQKGAIQILAATTNTLFGTQTFGITFGTSNCGAAAVSTSATKSFIEGNREVLAKDAARGSGETITTLSNLAGCKDPAAVGAALQKRFAELFPAEKAHTEVSEAVLGALRGDEALACKAIG
ncbi:MAG TPA: DUF3015 family protein [Anaeromyxobacteraceae bacterium]|nr:DUF3015 family protein [Anaeromyxobacteraceae bacterium]